MDDSYFSELLEQPQLRHGIPQKYNKKCQFSLHIVTHLSQFMAQNSENLGG